jgi:hypothetical protein
MPVKIENVEHKNESISTEYHVHDTLDTLNKNSNSVKRNENTNLLN